MKNGNHDGSGRESKLHRAAGHRLPTQEPLDLAQVTTIDELVRAMARTAFTGRDLGQAADLLEAMACDPECFVVMTLAGPMTVAKQGLIITELIDRGIVSAIVSTGALLANDSSVEQAMSQVLEDWDQADVMCSYKLNHAMGAHLAKRPDEQRGILRSAYKKGVPVFVPAFTDSQMGLDVALNNRMRESTGRHKIRFDPFEDLEHFAATLLRQNRLGVFTIGGGVPHNWAQQFGSFIELRQRRLNENVPFKRFHYGVRICPEPAHGEAISWSNCVPAEEGGRFCEVLVDATVGLPIIAAALLERLGPAKPGPEGLRKEKLTPARKKLKATVRK